MVLTGSDLDHGSGGKSTKNEIVRGLQANSKKSRSRQAEVDSSNWQVLRIPVMQGVLGTQGQTDVLQLD
jgi:hypothetical protein